MKRIKVTTAIAPDDHVPGLKILHRKAKRVKFDRTMIVNSEATNRNQVLNERRSDNNIV